MAKTALLEGLGAAAYGVKALNQRNAVSFGTHTQGSRNPAKACTDNKRMCCAVTSIHFAHVIHDNAALPDWG
jgi:hypothetical protein